MYRAFIDSADLTPYFLMGERLTARSRNRRPRTNSLGHSVDKRKTRKLIGKQPVNQELK